MSGTESSSSIGPAAVPMWRATAAGFCAILSGLGLARFAYTPLIPAVVGAGWFTAADAAYLGAANLAGYLAGALLARRAAERLGPANAVRSMMLLVTVTFFASAVPLSFLWFFIWRFGAGLAGGLLMVLAAPTVLPHISPARRGIAGGIMLTGVGAGIAASGTLIPLLLDIGLAETWCGLGGIAALLTILAWGGWPRTRAPGKTLHASAKAPRPRVSLALGSLYAEYALSAIGQVPHMVFLVDFVARGLGRGIEAGAQVWILFGLGALIGPTLFGHLGDRIGFRRALRLGFLLQAAGVGLLAGTTAPALVALSSFLIGAFIPGNVSLVLGRVQELAGPDAAAQRAAWGMATIAFAVGQAIAAYGYSFIFDQTGGAYGVLFALAAAALLLALATDIAAAAGERLSADHHLVAGGATADNDAKDSPHRVKLPANDGLR